MAITQQGALNTTALVVPGLYINIVPPGLLALNGVPSNLVGVVGTASWGPVGLPVTCSGPSDCTQAFGAMQNRKYDLGTQVATASAQLANNFACVRVTDATDVAATIVVQSTCITFNARYTGTLGNSATVTIANGSRGATFKATVSIGGGVSAFPSPVPEVFDNLALGLSGNAVWVAIAAAINNGTGPLRPASKIITATAGAGVTAPALATYTLAGGTDGASTAAAVATTPSIILGTDVAPRTGIYALRSKNCALLIVADMDTSSAWTTIDGFSQSEGIYAIQTGPAGDTVSNAVTTLGTAGISSYTTKMMFGDWAYWLDGVNGLTRLVSPQGFIAGRLANLTPNRSSLNQPIAAVVGTQKSGVPGTTQAQSYANADLTALFNGGLDVIGNPSPGGNYFSCLGGRNSSSSAAVNSDTYTRMTNYLASSLNAGMGKYVGQPITTDLFNNITGTLNNYLAGLTQQGLLTPNLADGSPPYQVLCNASNNPQSRTSLGYVQADVQVTYEGVNAQMIVNLQGGATVVTSKANQQTAV